MTSSRGRRPERIGDILRERIGALGWDCRLREEELLTSWDTVVGPQIAAHARPSHIANRRLTVVTESPVWTQQLSLLKPDLLQRIARSCGGETVTDLYFVTGKIDPAPRQPAPAAAAAPTPTALPAALEEELAQIPDADVRECIRGLMLTAAGADDAVATGEPNVASA